MSDLLEIKNKKVGMQDALVIMSNKLFRMEMYYENHTRLY